MNHYKRAGLSLQRQPGKVTVLTILLFILGTLMSGAISIQRSFHNTEANLMAQLPAVATVVLDDTALMASFQSTGEITLAPPPSLETLQAIGGLPYVRNYDFSIVTQLYSTTLTRYWNPDEGTSANNWDSLAEQGVYHIERFFVRGVQNPKLQDIEEGRIELIDGRTFTEAEIDIFSPVAIISNEFASHNNLQVGSVINLEARVYDTAHLIRPDASDWYNDDNLYFQEIFPIEIIGIFNVLENLTGHRDEFLNTSRNQDFLNTFYMPNSFAIVPLRQTIQAHESLWTWEEIPFNDSIFFDFTYWLYDARDLQTFSGRAAELLPAYWKVQNFSNSFDLLSVPMANMIWLSNLILVATLGATLIIVILLITLFLRDRKHEIGIYRALGEKKAKIISQILLETLTPAIFAITLALFTGSFLSAQLSREMLHQQLIQEQTERESAPQFATLNLNSMDWLHPGEMTADEMIAAYDTSLDFPTILIFYSVGTATIIIAALIPITKTASLNPKKILL